MATEEKRISADLECIGDEIVEAGLDPVARDRRNSIARRNLHIAKGVGKGAVGADLQRVEESRIDERVARVELQLFGLEIGFGFNTLAPRRADVLEIAKSYKINLRYLKRRNLSSTLHCNNNYF